MQSDSELSPAKKRVALVGIPDDALDVLNHYTQSTECETVVVVAESYEDYAVRMAEILGVPVASTVDTELLSGCDLVVVGEGMSVTAAEVRNMVAGTGVEVTTLNEVTESLGILPFQEVGVEGEMIELAPGDIDSIFDDMGLPGSPSPVPEEPLTDASYSVNPAAETMEPMTEPAGDPGYGFEPGVEEMPVAAEADVETFEEAAPLTEAVSEPDVETFEEAEPLPEAPAAVDVETFEEAAPLTEAVSEPDVETFEEAEPLPGAPGAVDVETFEEAEPVAVTSFGPEAELVEEMDSADSAGDLPLAAEARTAGESEPVTITPAEPDPTEPEPAAIVDVAPGDDESPEDTENDMDHQDMETGTPIPRPTLVVTDSSRASVGALTAAGVLPVDGKHEAVRALLARVLERTGATTGSILVPEPGEERLRFAHAIGLPAAIVAETRPKVGEGLAGKAYASGEHQVILAEVPDLAEVGNSVRYRLAASAPILREGRVIAVLSVNVESDEPIDEHGVVSGLSECASTGVSAVLAAVDLPRLDLDTRGRFILARLDEIMGSSDPFPSRLRAVGELLRRAVGADYAHVYLVDPLGRRLELATSTEGVSGAGKTVSLDRGWLGSIARSSQCSLLTLPDPDAKTVRAMAGLPIHAGGPYALVVLENFEVPSDEREGVEELLTGVVHQLEEVFEIERGVESQDVLSGLKMRIADQSSQLEILPPELRAQSALEFAIQILAAEVAVWLPGPSERPVIAQPQTRMAARIVADVWDELESLGAWVREQGSCAEGGNAPGWDQGGPKGPSPYVGVKDGRGDAVLLAFFAPGEEGGPTVQLPARILLEALATVAALIPVPESSESAAAGPGLVEREALDNMVVHETRRAQRSNRPFALTRFELEGEASEDGVDRLRRFLLEHKRVVDVFSEIDPGMFVMLSPDTDPDEPGLRERYQALWEEEGARETISMARCRFPYYEVSTGYPRLVSHPDADRKAA